MKLRSLGYVGQNLATGRTTGRTLRLANLTSERAAEVTERNLEDLSAILRWNVEHDIRCFRIGSSVVPFASHPDFRLDWQSRFADEFAQIRDYAEENALRLSMHPGQYTVLNSPHQQVVENSLAELEYHAQFLSLVAPHDGTMTLHIGGAYGDRHEALARFRENFGRLSDRARARLVLENDDTTFDIFEVLELCHDLGRPAVFDFFHHRCLNRSGDGGEGLAKIVEEVVVSWQGATPKFHLSSARERGLTAHADFIAESDLLDAVKLLAQVDGEAPFDLMLEAKAKEGAALEALATLRSAARH